VPAESVCAHFLMAAKPEGGDECLVLCELQPRHKPPHHGHLRYEKEKESRCIDWTGGPAFVGFLEE